MTSIAVTPDILAKTIVTLREAGARGQECVVLWLAPAAVARPPAPIVEVYRPLQVADVDYFRLPPQSMRAMMAHMREARLKIAAQVHSHPAEAFHSEVDDEWAIIRHVGAMSLVLPRFAFDTTVANFAAEAASYELSPGNEWLPVATLDRLEISA